MICIGYDYSNAENITDYHKPNWCLDPLPRNYFHDNFDISVFKNIGVKLTSIQSWRQAMLKVQHYCAHEFKHLKFHPLQEFSYLPEAAFQGHPVIMLVLHADGLETSHHLTADRGVTGCGYLVMNLRKNVKRHHFYIRFVAVPKNTKWDDTLLKTIIRKDLKTLRKGIPIRSRTQTNKYEMVYAVLAGTF